MKPKALLNNPIKVLVPFAISLLLLLMISTTFGLDGIINNALNIVILLVVIILLGACMVLSQQPKRSLEESEDLSCENEPEVVIEAHDDRHSAKISEALLQENNKQLEHLIQHLPVGVVLHGADTHITFVNDYAKRFLGTSLAKIDGALDWSLIHNDGSICTAEEYPASLIFRTHEPIKDLIVGIVHPRKKNPTWVLVNGFPEFDQQGNLHQVLITYANISSHKMAEIELGAEKERLAVTLKSIGDGVITTDIYGKIMMLNQSAEKLTGWQSEQAVRRPLSEVFVIVNEETRKPSPNPVDMVLETGKVTEFSSHSCLISKEGKKVIISENAAPIHDSNGQMIGVILVFRDITQKVELTESLQKSQKLDSLGVLAGGIAHDFNNLLGGIFGYLDIAQSQNDAAKSSEYITKALNTIERAKELTQQLLTFSKGGDPIKKVANLFPFIQNRVFFALSGSNVSASFSVDDNVDLCNYDENQIAQVIDNLVINAQQAMPEGGSIEVHAQNSTIGSKKHPELSPGQYVKISITDHGHGIPTELIPFIFDPFFTSRENGKGLGLSTSYSIINRHGGCIEVASTINKGTTFSIYIPSAGVGIQQDIEDDDPDSFIEKGTILVMEDESFMQEIIESMLTMIGYDVVLKNNGQDAIDFFKKSLIENRPVLAMIFDLTIPGGMGGKEAIQEIRKLSESIPVFVASGYAQDPIMADPRTYGFNDSITKPFRLTSLTQMLKKHLRKKR